ncbi:MAG: hypothetical protein J6T13_03595 [Bacteroidales bacterium]|nr:hypothetical protein [Bacteroidales bacterium]
MDSTTKRNDNRKREHKPWLRKVFGGEFLLSEQMRPWYPYIAFVLLLAAILVLNEQLVNEKKAEINRLENEYKSELSRLKANNQFIPYEENQILIQKMKDRGYVLDEEHNYTIHVPRPVKEKRHVLFFWKNRKKDVAASDSVAVEVPDAREDENVIQ